MPPPAPTAQLAPRESALSPLAGWLILVLLAIGVLISFLDRSSIGSAIADKAFIHEFGLSPVGRGWLNSAFFWSYGVTQVPMGWLVDRYGVKRPYAIFFAMWCVISALTGLISMLPLLIVARLLVGVAEAVVIPASYRWIRNNFDERHNGLAVGIFAMGNKFGPAIGAPAAAWLIVHYSWRMVFFAMCAVGVAWLIAWIGLVPDDAPAGAARAKLRKGPATTRTITIGTALRSPVVWGGMVTNFCYGYFTFYCMTWMPAYLVEQRHLSLAKSGIYTFFSFAGIALMAVFAGWAADRVIARYGNAVLVRKCFVTAGFVGGCTVLFGIYAHSLQAALFWNVLSLTLLGFTTANNLALCRLTLIPKPAVGLVTGIQQLATSLAGGVSASLSGWLLSISGNYDLPMKVIFVFMVIGAAATWLLLRPEWAPRLPPELPEDNLLAGTV